MGHRTLAQQKMGHEKKKVENRWPRASHCLNPALMSVFRGGAIAPCPLTFPSSKQEQY